MPAAKPSAKSVTAPAREPHTLPMPLLDPLQFVRVRPIMPPASDAGHLAFAHAVVDGLMPGSIIVDDLVLPGGAIIENDCDFHVAVGEPPHHGVDTLVREAVAANKAGRGDIWCSNERWADALRPHFSGSRWRNEYHPPTTLPPTRDLPPGYTLVSIDARIAARFAEDGVDPWVIDIWGGIDAFLAQTFGFAVVDEAGKLASFCTFCGLGGGEAEIEIGTSDTHRQKGLAYIAGRAFMAESMSRGIAPAWTCATDNEPSARLADSLGYHYFRKVEGFSISAAIT